ncbi:MAG TPA: hypothetical protein VG711_07695, partial [Phycisphaerales bacterium]|nr:hypothetical protein [Phycisphaerales bacterium]
MAILMNERAVALSQSEGLVLLSSGEAVLKGVLEAEAEVGMLAGPARGGFELIFDGAERTGVDSILREYNVRLQRTADAVRGLRVARAAAERGMASLAWVPNDELDECVSVLTGWRDAHLKSGVGMVILLEDNPAGCPVTCPRQTSQRLELVAIEASDLESLKIAIDEALRLSEVAHAPVGIVVHQRVLRACETVRAAPNSKSESLSAMLARRRQREVARGAETNDVLRTSRRMELNEFSAMPIRGERVATGFVTVGPAEGAMRHLVDVLGLHGRVPMLHLKLIEP